MCQHYFQGNRYGSSNFCLKLGYNGGFGTLYLIQKFKERITADSWAVGRGTEQSDLLTARAGGNQRFMHDQCVHSRQELDAMGFKCDGELANTGRVASCNEDILLENPLKTEPPAPDKVECEDGDIMFVSNGTMNGRLEHEEEFGHHMTGGVGEAYILFEGEWASICADNFRDNNHGANTFCQKLGYEFGTAGTPKLAYADLDPAINLGTCAKGQDLLECESHDVRSFLGQCANKKRRNPLIITCSGVFTGVASSCQKWQEMPYARDRLAALNAAVDHGNNTQEQRCPPNKQEATFGLEFPSQIMTCPHANGAVLQTSCNTLKSQDVYTRIAWKVVEMYESLSSECDKVCCPQADLAACILRFAGHDFMDFNTQTYDGGSNGCIDFSDVDNRGLFPCLAGDGEFSQGLTIGAAYADFCSEVSLADFIVITAEVLMMRTRDDWAGVANMPTRTFDLSEGFKFGRRTAETCSPKPLPNPERSCVAVEENFVQELGLTWPEAVAMMGVHTLGRTSVHNSGYDGWWNEGPEGRSFNNSYYVSLVAKGWMPKNMGPGKNQWVRSDGGSDMEMMLDTDLCLLYDTEPKTVEKKILRRSVDIATATPSGLGTPAVGTRNARLSDDAADWSTAMKYPGKRCSVQLWEERGISRLEAQAKCEQDIECVGLMWYNADSSSTSSGQDGRSVASGWYQGCGGTSAKSKSATWDTIELPPSFDKYYEGSEFGESIGGFGGKCQCPSGETYFVGDKNNNCRSISCYGGTPGSCSSAIPKSGKGKGVKCGGSAAKYRQAGQTSCGVGGRCSVSESQLNIGINGGATSAAGAEVWDCADTCDGVDQCAGFEYDTVSKTCHFRGSTSCNIDRSVLKSTCYTKQNIGADGAGGGTKTVSSKQAMAAVDTCCAWTSTLGGLGDTIQSQCFNKDANANACCKVGGGLTCGDEDNPQGSPGADSVKLFAQDEAAWLEVFVKAWRKATTNGQASEIDASTCNALPATMTTTTRTQTSTTTTIPAAWNKAKVESETVADDADRCYYGIFKGEKCKSAGAVYKIAPQWQNQSKCGTVVEHFTSATTVNVINPEHVGAVFVDLKSPAPTRAPVATPKAPPAPPLPAVTITQSGDYKWTLVASEDGILHPGADGLEEGGKFQTVVIQQGTVVTFEGTLEKNHNFAVKDSTGKDIVGPAQINQGGEPVPFTFTWTASEAGEYKYYCQPHASFMEGTIQVYVPTISSSPPPPALVSELGAAYVAPFDCNPASTTPSPQPDATGATLENASLSGAENIVTTDADHGDTNGGASKKSGGFYAGVVLGGLFAIIVGVFVFRSYTARVGGGSNHSKGADREFSSVASTIEAQMTNPVFSGKPRLASSNDWL